MDRWDQPLMSITGKRGAHLGTAEGRLVVSSTAGGRITITVSDGRTHGVLYMTPQDAERVAGELSVSIAVLDGWRKAAAR